MECERGPSMPILSTCTYMYVEWRSFISRVGTVVCKFQVLYCRGGVSCCSRFRVSVGASEHPFKNHSTILAGFVYVLITNRSCTFFFFFAYEKKLFC